MHNAHIRRLHMKLIFYAKIFTLCVGAGGVAHTGVCSIILTAVHTAEQSRAERRIRRGNSCRWQQQQHHILIPVPNPVARLSRCRFVALFISLLRELCFCCWCRVVSRLACFVSCWVLCACCRLTHTHTYTNTLAREFTKLLSVRSGAVRLRLSRLDGLNNFQNVSLDVAHLLPLLLLLLLLFPFLLLLLVPVVSTCNLLAILHGSSCQTTHTLTHTHAGTCIRAVHTSTHTHTQRNHTRCVWKLNKVASVADSLVGV